MAGKWRTGGDVYIGDPMGNAVALTDAEYDALVHERAIKEKRQERDELLRKVVDAMNPMRWEALSAAEQQAYRDYRQALLDVPQQEGFPHNIVWPTEPIGG
jgi:hypothetical protein